MANILYTLSMQRRSFIGDLHPLSILSAVGGAVVIVFSTLNTWVYLGLLLFLAAVMMVDRIPLKQLGKMVLVILPMCFFITLIQVLAQTKDPFYSTEILGKTITFSSYGLELGIRISARVLLLALPLSLFFMIVSPMRLTRALYDAGIPFKYAYLFTLGLRFLPLVLDEITTINNAQKSRGYDIDQSNFVVKVIRIIPLMIPLILSLLKRAETIALAMDLQGFNAYDKRSFLVEVHKRPIDAIIRWSSLFTALGVMAWAIFLQH